MPYYMVQVAGSPGFWAAMVKTPQNRAELARATVERLGGRLHSWFWSFGEDDRVTVMELPDAATAAAIAAAASAGGNKAVKTMPLFTAEEGIEFLRKAVLVGYRPPSG